MKKIFFIGLIFSLFFLTGCGKYTEKSIIKDINKKFNSISGYHIEGNMEIYNGDDVYKYDVIDMKTILEGNCKKNYKKIAPPEGLYLKDVTY